MTIFRCFARDSFPPTPFSPYMPLFPVSPSFVLYSLSQTLLTLSGFVFYRKIVELEEELRVVGNNLKSLEVSEEKVSHSLSRFISFILITKFLLPLRSIKYLYI